MKKLLQLAPTRFAFLALLTIPAISFDVVPSWAQTGTVAVTSSESDESLDGEMNALERGRYAVLIDLDENRLYFKEGDVTLWSAPVGTGTGMRVITDDNDWNFSTPRGRFQVQYKEQNPVWIAPDWNFVENNLPVPPTNHPSRNMTGTLGEAAVYISPHLAIHGTNRPELIGQRVSHGCIRLENRYAKRLFHNVQVGTEVIIVGGEEVDEKARVVDLREGYDASLASRGGRRTLAVDELYESWRKMDTAEMAAVLDAELAAEPSLSRWDEVAIILLNRARTDDDEAMDLLFNRAGSLPTRSIEREWATLLADAYSRSAERTLESLAALDIRERRRAASMLVSGTVTLYGGDLDAPSAPWPTSRVPRDVVSVRAARGWDSLFAAERDHRVELTRLANARD